MNKRKLIIILSGLAIIAFSFFSMSFLSGMKKDPPKSIPEEIVRFVKAAPINYASLETKIKVGGRLLSKSEIVISAEVSGKILTGQIDFKRGEVFKEGDLLIKIYDKEAELNLKSRKSTFLNKVASSLPEFKTSFPDQYEKWSAFLVNINIENDLPSLPDLNSSQVKVFVSTRNILSEYYSIKGDELRLKKYNIYAPFNGAITEVNMQVGAIANPGAVLGRIINTEDLEMEVPMEINDAKWIRVGEAVTVYNEDGTEKWQGKLIRKSQDVDVNTQSINVYVSLQSISSKQLYKGQYLVAEFKGIKLNNVMEIQRSAVFNSNEVFVIKDNRLSKAEIVIKKINERTLFFNGLDEGIEIVIEPLVNARENTKVEIIK
ncbi:MAG: efflux RND transporter periplasmic adaptor subunit [Bacteroidetes bacterium]|nr:efflux RND transporter periplasmic adaptor subunit [Bacteroidota bacterium]